MNAFHTNARKPWTAMQVWADISRDEYKILRKAALESNIPVSRLIGEIIRERLPQITLQLRADLHARVPVHR